MSSFIIDRRKNASGRNLANRERFLARARQKLKSQVQQQFASPGQSIQGQTGGSVSVSDEDFADAKFRFDPAIGVYRYVIPGNHEYIVGDRIYKPPQNPASPAGGSGSGEDDFEFLLSYDEFIEMVFDDLELPNLEKKTDKEATAFSVQRAGYSPVGQINQLNVEKTAISGIARRLALKTPKLARARELQEELDLLLRIALPDDQENARIRELEEEIARLKAAASAIGYLDNVDLRYNQFVKTPKPHTKALVVFLMDDSGSMTEGHKRLSKKFFLLMNLFLRRNYKSVENVFVRYNSEAKECSEVEFFTSTTTGGTTVSSGLQLTKEILASRYNSDDWNIYIVHASDGDTGWDDDIAKSKQILAEDLLPVCQAYTYLEVGTQDEPIWSWFSGQRIMSNLFSIFFDLIHEYPARLSLAKVEQDVEVVPVFRELFKKGAFDGRPDFHG